MTQNKRSTPQDILQLLQNLEKRISRIEERLDIIPAQKNSLKKAGKPLSAETDNIAESLEFNIGKYWFAKVGIFVLAIGIVFILTFPYRNLPPYVPSLIGYGLFSLIWTASFFLRKSFAHVAGYLLTGNFLLLYFSTLRLYYFGDLPVFNNKLLILSLLIFVVILIIYLSLRQKSVLNCGIGLTLMYVTTLTADSALTIFIMISVTALFAAYILLKYQWYNIFIYSIVLTYFFHFIWFINNPFLGNRIQFVSQPEYNIWFVLIYTTVFALALLFRPNREKEDGAYITATFLNSGGGYGLLLILTLPLTGFFFSISILVKLKPMTVMVMHLVKCYFCKKE